MDKRSTIVIASIILVAIIGFIFISFQKSAFDAKRAQEIASTTAWENAPAEQSNTVVVSQKTVVTAKHAYLRGVHTIAGEIPMPTPCHILEASVIASDDKKQVLIKLISSIKSDEICAQVITPARFKVTAEADKGAEILGMLNGQEIIMNLIEAGVNENLDDFELYLKG